MELELKRTYNPGGVTGVLQCCGEHLAYTLEQPWRDNKIGVSCIPEGEYEIGLKFYGRYHDKWHGHDWYQGVLILEGTSPRAEILIHPANYINEIRGCICPVTTLDEQKGIPVGWSSNQAFRKVYDMIIHDLVEAKKVSILIN